MGSHSIKKLFLIFILLFITFCLSLTDSTSSENSEVPIEVLRTIIKDKIAESPDAVVFHGNYAFVGNGQRLIVLDTRNSIDHIGVGSIDLPGCFVEAITIDDTKAYVAAGGADGKSI